jgi:hypothetical protein
VFERHCRSTISKTWLKKQKFRHTLAESYRAVERRRFKCIYMHAQPGGVLSHVTRNYGSARLRPRLHYHLSLGFTSTRFFHSPHVHSSHIASHHKDWTQHTNRKPDLPICTHAERRGTATSTSAYDTGVSDGSLDIADGIEPSPSSEWSKGRRSPSQPPTSASPEAKSIAPTASFAIARRPVPSGTHAQQSASKKARRRGTRAAAWSQSRLDTGLYDAAIPPIEDQECESWAIRCHGDITRVSYGTEPAPRAYHTSVEIAAVPRTYDPLPDGSIRLTRIIQDPLTGRIACCTRQFTLQDPPPYTAVSYACGSRPASFHLKLNGTDWYIRKNLSRFLRQRGRTDPNSHDWLWIDAICIDQGNPSERTHQVKLMADIYGKATRVLVWLGPAYQNSGIAMAGLRNSYDVNMSPSRVRWLVSFRSLCSRGYWRRLWCLQELSLSRERDIMCGSWIVPWNLFQSCIWNFMHGTFDNMGSLDRYWILGFRKTAAFRMMALASDSRRTLWHLLDTTRHLQCEEDRDKVYALLGLALDAGSIEPDYSSKLPIFLNEVLEYYIEHSDADPSKDYIVERRAAENLGHISQLCEKVEIMFGAQRGTIFELTDSTTHFSGPGLLYQKFLMHATISPGMTLLWAIRYEHPLATEYIKMVHRRQSPASYIASALCFAGAIAGFPLSLRIALKHGMWAVFLPITLLAMAVAFGFLVYLSLAGIRAVKTNNTFSDWHPHQARTILHPWLFLTFTLGAVFDLLITSVFRLAKHWFRRLGTPRQEGRAETELPADDVERLDWLVGFDEYF